MKDGDMGAIVEPQILVVVHCARCTVPFGITENMKDRRLKDGKDFYCPNGHPNAYFSK